MVQKRMILALIALLTPYLMVAKTCKFTGKWGIHLYVEFKNICVFFRSVKRIDELMLVNHVAIPRSKMCNEHYHYLFQ